LSIEDGQLASGYSTQRSETRTDAGGLHGEGGTRTLGSAGTRWQMRSGALDEPYGELAAPGATPIQPASRPPGKLHAGGPGGQARPAVSRAQQRHIAVGLSVDRLG